MNKFLTFSYYFSARPDADFHFTKLFLLAVAILYVASISIWIYRKKYAQNAVLKKMIKKYPANLFTIGTVLLFLLLSRESGIPILSMRVWLFLLIIISAVIFIKNAITFKSEYKKKMDQSEHHEVKSKYLPKKKKK